MYQEAVDTSVAVLKRMQKHEAVGYGGGMDHGMNAVLSHAMMSGNQSRHHVG